MDNANIENHQNQLHGSEINAEQYPEIVPDSRLAKFFMEVSSLTKVSLRAVIVLNQLIKPQFTGKLV